MDGLVFLDEDYWDYQLAGRATIEMAQLRERQMALNVLWWMSQHPQERMILWGANIHVARTHAGLDIPMAAARGYSRRNSVPAGQWLAESLGKNYFAVAISAARGQTGRIGAESLDAVGPAAPGQLEHEIPEGALRSLMREDLPRGASPGLMMGGSPATANWAQLFDAVLVLPSERPVARRADCEG